MASQYEAELAKEDIESVKQLQKDLHAAAELMANQGVSENVVIFIGATKSGKSTLINYLLDNSLVGVKGNRLTTTIQKADNSNGPSVGFGIRSETIIPTRWENSRRLPGFTIWDAPGFDDNRGKIQDITNAFYLYELFKTVNFIKIVLVVDIQHVMREPINQFLTLLKSVENLFQGRMRDCFSSIATIFTKVNDSVKIDENFLNELLEPVWTNLSLDMSPNSREFIRYLTNHPANIGFFKQANEGPVTETIEEGVTMAIQQATSVPKGILKDALSPSIADNSKVFLYNCRDKISSVTEFNELQMRVCEVLEEILRECSEVCMANELRHELPTIREKLKLLENQIDRVLNLRNNLCEKLHALKDIDPRIERAMTYGKLIEKSNLMEFIDNLLDLKESKHFDFNLQSIMVTGKSKIKEIGIYIRLLLNEIDKKEAECKIIDIKDQCQKISLVLTNELEELRSKDHTRGVVTIIFNEILDIVLKRFSRFQSIQF